MTENTEEPKTNTTDESQAEPETTEEQEEQTETENLFHKLYLFGLGLQKDLEETISKLIEKGEVKAGEKEKIVNDFVKKAKESSSTIERKLEELINNTLEGMNLVTKEKYDALEKRVNELEKKIKELHPE